MLTVVYGSARKGGNTDLLTDAFIKGTGLRESSIKRFYLRTLSLQPCTACGACDKTGICVFNDDIRKIYEEMDKSSFLLVASPITFASVSAQAKAYIDRGQAFWVRKFVLGKEPPEITKDDEAGFKEQGDIDNRADFKEQEDIDNRASFKEQEDIDNRASFKEQEDIYNRAGYKEPGDIDDRTGFKEQGDIDKKAGYKDQYRTIEKKGFFISVGGMNTYKYFQNARMVIKTFMVSTGFKYSGDIFHPGVDKKGEILDVEGALAAAEASGREFIY